MSLGIKLPADSEYKDSAFWIYFDAVSLYSRTQRGQVTKNPTARGRSSTDNFTAENPTFGFTAIISFADISSVYSLIRDDEENLADNAIDQPDAATIQSSSNSMLNFLPESIGQFLKPSNSSVTVSPIRTNYKTYVETCLTKLMSGSFYNSATGKTETRIRPVKLFEFEGVALSKTYEDLCLVGMDIKETVDSGNALFCDLQFEQVSFVTLKTTALSSDVVKSLKTKAAPKAKKGSVPKVDEVKDESDELENLPQ